MVKITDQHIRTKALDVKKSFIVQAPAGSGKTELLVQRLLKLLSVVKQPEQILAITFTRKAAAEMQLRVCQALLLASKEEPEAEHAKLTWRLARQALIQDEKLNWQLLQNPQRLGITTIDSFSAKLASHMPLLAKLGQVSNIVENANDLYVMAVEYLLEDLEQEQPWQQEVKLLLKHLDNRFDLFINLLVTMLAKREQWLDVVVNSKDKKDLQQLLEQNLEQVQLDCLRQVKICLTTKLQELLFPLLSYANTNFAKQMFPDDIAEDDLSLWQNLANCLLSNQGGYRKMVDKRQGFIAIESVKGSTEKNYVVQQKQKMHDLLLVLHEHPDLLLQLQLLQRLPVVGYSEQQKKILSALLNCLQIAVGYLHVIFTESGTLDFNEISLAALQSLGSLQSPSDLALSLDYKLQHILVDEFQDTSELQYKLLYALTQGWQQGDQNSLFLVGDPMQSIYRFRQADVGLFLQTAKSGLGDIKLEYLQLSCNFRSGALLVDWFNELFSKILPESANAFRGAVSYHSAEKVLSDEASVTTEFCETSSLHDQAIVAYIKQQIELDPKQSIAILVRSRGHINSILPALRQAGVSYSAVELEALSEQAVIRDLQALTFALLHLGDKLSWFAILRSPWCGLNLSDLTLLATECGENKTVWQCLQNQTYISKLSLDAKTRLAKIVPILALALQQKDRVPLRSWVEQTWQQLSGPQCLQHEFELVNAERYFELLSEYAVGTRIINKKLLLQRLSQLRANGDAASFARVQIMTIHKSKGLEFDVVILPNLQATSRADTPSLLLWQDYPVAHGLPKLLLAPIKSYKSKEDKIYNFLYSIEQDRAFFELKRLLYVAVSRAKKHLYLTAKVEFDTEDKLKKPAIKSFLGLLWPFLDDILPASGKSSSSEIELHTKQDSNDNNIYRLPLDHFKKGVLLSPIKTPSEFKLSKKHEALVKSETEINRVAGIIIHQYLAIIANQGVVSWSVDKIERHSSSIQRLLQQHGLFSEQMYKAEVLVKQALVNTLNYKHGIWLLSDHYQAKSELALLDTKSMPAQVYVIDRCFIDEDNCAWVIDYKTVQKPKEQTQADFIKSQQELYASKMCKYAQLVADFYKTDKVKVALYFTFDYALIPLEGDFAMFGKKEKQEI